MNIDSRGVVVSVVPGSPAETAGVPEGARIIAVNKRIVDGKPDIYAVLSTGQSSADFSFQLGYSIQYEDAPPPPPPGSPPGTPTRGNSVEYEEGIAPESRPRTYRLEKSSRFGYGMNIDTVGVVVSVVPGSPADGKGVPAGSKIIGVNGTPVVGKPAIVQQLTTSEHGGVWADFTLKFPPGVIAPPSPVKEGQGRGSDDVKGSGKKGLGQLGGKVRGRLGGPYATPVA
jgi:membrane-associated protease RseP (regulator of RpoE activity)